MANIKADLFHAAATIYQGLLEARTNRMPQDPSHAHRAQLVASALYKATNGDGIQTNAGARILVGFLKNEVALHCSDDELVNHTLHGLRHLLDAFNGHASVFQAPPVQQQPLITQTPPFAPTMPPAAPPLAQSPAPHVYASPPVPMGTPDFSEAAPVKSENDNLREQLRVLRENKENEALRAEILRLQGNAETAHLVPPPSQNDA